MDLGDSVRWGSTTKEILLRMMVHLHTPDMQTRNQWRSTTNTAVTRTNTRMISARLHTGAKLIMQMIMQMMMMMMMMMRAC